MISHGILRSEEINKNLQESRLVNPSFNWEQCIITDLYIITSDSIKSNKSMLILHKEDGTILAEFTVTFHNSNHDLGMKIKKA